MSTYQALFILEYGPKCGALLLTKRLKCPLPRSYDIGSLEHKPCKDCATVRQQGPARLMNLG